MADTNPAVRGKVKDDMGDRLFYMIVYVILGLLAIITLYPIIYVASASFSDPEMVFAGRVVLLPVGFSLEGYRKIFENNGIVSGFLNSIFYTGVGTCINLTMTVLADYPISRSELKGRKSIMMLFTYNMIINGGMIAN